MWKSILITDIKLLSYLRVEVSEYGFKRVNPCDKYYFGCFGAFLFIT